MLRCACVRACVLVRRSARGRRCRMCAAPRGCTRVRLRDFVRASVGVSSRMQTATPMRACVHACIARVSVCASRTALHRSRRGRPRPARRTPTVAQSSDRKHAPGIRLHVNVGAVCEQCRHHRRVPGPSGIIQRRGPAADRARAHTACACINRQMYDYIRTSPKMCLCMKA